MCHTGYYTLMRESKEPRQLRLRLVQTAKRLGIKPAAKLFGCSPNTVRKWLSRFNGTLASLQEQSRAPHNCPNKLSREAEQEIIRAHRKLPVWGVKRLKHDLQLPYSVKAISRVLREHGCLRKWRRKKPQTKHCLRQVKKQWALWQQISADTKHLYDLPEYLLQARQNGLPLYQYTAREVSCGVLFLGYSQELSLTYAELFARRIMNHLATHSVELPQVTIQSDNGSEFIGSWQAKEDSAFTRAIESRGARHRTIPPGAHRFQADVETVHSLMEAEFYLERFRHRREFISKAETYQNFFNYVRPNSGKEHKPPWDLIQEKLPQAKPSLLYLPPVFLEDLLHQRLHPPGVHDVGGLPSEPTICSNLCR
jgi:transposase